MSRRAGDPDWDETDDVIAAMFKLITWYLALCEECTPPVPQPFTDEEARDGWATDHIAATGHAVQLITQEPRGA